MKSPTSSAPLSGVGRLLWTTAEYGALAVTAAVLAGLLLAPEATLTIAWFGIVPILPASFLINAGLWRGVCPIATAGGLLSRPSGRALKGSWSTWAAITGMVLLLVLVPARRLFLNQDALVLALTLVAIVAAALVLGGFFRTKAGFCNAICPILPVEKLYGQSPLVWVRNARCVPCTACTHRGCLDLGQQRAVTGNGRNTSGRAWMRSPMGVFAAAFPGFVFGYFQTSDVGLAEWAGVYSAVLGPALLSLVVVGGLIYLINIPARLAAPVLGAAAVGLYYWYAGPASAEAFSWSPDVGIVLRWITLALVVAWLTVALTRQHKSAASA